jgi:uncharacterized C2H2 Zn-finger protein
MTTSREKRLISQRKYYASHKDKAHVYYLANKDKIARAYKIRGWPYDRNAWANDLMRKYNLPIEEYDQMFLRQEGKCAICGKESRLRLSVDYNHSTGVIRGLLCRHCNLALGFYFDDPEIVSRIADYLKKYLSA